jgi:hypothetical protein
LGDTLEVPPEQAAFLAPFQAFRKAFPTDTVAIFPDHPGLYAVLGTRSLVYENFGLFPEFDFKQRRTIEQLDAKNITWVLINKRPVDEREDLVFPKTHPLVWKHIATHYRLDDAVTSSLSGYLAFRRPAR